MALVLPPATPSLLLFYHIALVIISLSVPFIRDIYNFCCASSSESQYTQLLVIAASITEKCMNVRVFDSAAVHMQLYDISGP